MVDISLLLAWGATYKKFAIGKTIFVEGQSCSFYYQLVTGKARWINVDDNGKEFIHTLVGPGESFGEISLFDDGPYAATAIADEDSLVIRLSKSKFLKLIKENSEISFAFTKLLAQRLRFRFLVIKSFSSHNPEHRIATLLNYLKLENNSLYTVGTQLKLTRQQIADMTGLRVETVIRTMRVMHDKGDLVIEKGKVYCKDMIEILSL